MSKFRKGDRVILVKNTPLKSEGWIGIISREVFIFNYYAVGEFDNEEHAFYEDELELLRLVKAEDVKPQDILGFYTSTNKADAVNSPKHYSVFEKLEAIEVIASSMTVDQFYGYCLGNILKYRLRAGGKDDIMQELGKADKYQELFTKYKHLCKGVQ